MRLKLNAKTCSLLRNLIVSLLGMGKTVIFFYIGGSDKENQ